MVWQISRNGLTCPRLRVRQWIRWRASWNVGQRTERRGGEGWLPSWRKPTREPTIAFRCVPQRLTAPTSAPGMSASNRIFATS
jgi:hypothetical protein